MLAVKRRKEKLIPKYVFNLFQLRIKITLISKLVTVLYTAKPLQIDHPILSGPFREVVGLAS